MSQIVLAAVWCLGVKAGVCHKHALMQLLCESTLRGKLFAPDTDAGVSRLADSQPGSSHPDCQPA